MFIHQHRSAHILKHQLCMHFYAGEWLVKIYTTSSFWSLQMSEMHVGVESFSNLLPRSALSFGEGLCKRHYYRRRHINFPPNDYLAKASLPAVRSGQCWHLSCDNPVLAISSKNVENSGILQFGGLANALNYGLFDSFSAHKVVVTGNSHTSS